MYGLYYTNAVIDLDKIWCISHSGHFLTMDMLEYRVEYGLLLDEGEIATAESDYGKSKASPIFNGICSNEEFVFWVNQDESNICIYEKFSRKLSYSIIPDNGIEDLNIVFAFFEEDNICFIPENLEAILTFDYSNRHIIWKTVGDREKIGKMILRYPIRRGRNIFFADILNRRLIKLIEQDEGYNVCILSDIDENIQDIQLLGNIILVLCDNNTLYVYNKDKGVVRSIDLGISSYNILVKIENKVFLVPNDGGALYEFTNTHNMKKANSIEIPKDAKPLRGFTNFWNAFEYDRKIWLGGRIGNYILSIDYGGNPVWHHLNLPINDSDKYIAEIKEKIHDGILLNETEYEYNLKQFLECLKTEGLLHDNNCR